MPLMSMPPATRAFGSGPSKFNPDALAKRAPYFGTGVRPAPLPAVPAERAPRNLGLLNSDRLASQPRMIGSDPAKYNTYTPRPAGVGAKTTYDQFLKDNPGSQAATGVAPAVTRAAPNFDGLSGFGLENARANAGIYQPGSFGAQNAAANGTGYRPPQQTERANPLTGDNNFPMEGQSVPVAPFVQRGASLPAGRDALPAALRTTETEDDDIGRTMQGIQSRIAGSPTNLFARRFGQPAKQASYNSLLKRVMG